MRSFIRLVFAHGILVVIAFKNSNFFLLRPCPRYQLGLATQAH